MSNPRTQKVGDAKVEVSAEHTEQVITSTFTDLKNLIKTQNEELDTRISQVRLANDYLRQAIAFEEKLIVVAKMVGDVSAEQQKVPALKKEKKDMEVIPQFKKTKETFMRFQEKYKSIKDLVVPPITEEMKLSLSPQDYAGIEKSYNHAADIKERVVAIYKKSEVAQVQLTNLVKGWVDNTKKQMAGGAVQPIDMEAKHVNPGVAKAALFPAQNSKAQAEVDKSKSLAAGSAQAGKPNAQAK
jgi:hypothetical protein